MDKGNIDDNDDQIFLPQNIKEMLDYEYIFHTHPPTPSIGKRIKNDNVLYEFPSIQDIIHFIEHSNYGVTQGSIVMAPEGMYIIRKKKFNNKKIIIDKNTFETKFNDFWFDIQVDAITKYGYKFSENFFYEKIAQNKYFINKINKELEKFNLIIKYYPRSKDKNNNWVVNDVYIEVFPVEPK